MSTSGGTQAGPTVRLLGSLEVVGDSGPIDIGGAQPRVVLGLLAAAGGRAVSVDALIDAIWEDTPPPSASGTLQTYVSRLRRALGPVEGTIVREPAGYRLDIDAGLIDLHRFEALADDGRTALDAGDPASARTLLVEAGELWRGDALLEVRDRPQLAGIARRVDERRLAAVEDRLAADLALGRHAAVVGELAQLVTDHPLRERLWVLLALARYRSGQQADALRAIAEARSTLVDELGVEPGTELRDLEQAILAQDPTLDVVPQRSATPIADPAPSRDGPGGPSPDVARPSPGPVEVVVPARPALVGREAELGPLLRALDGAASGRPGFAVVRGEAGVGKTRLVEELADEALRRGGRVAWGRSLEGGAAPAYWPWLGALRPLRAADPGRANEGVDALIDATGVTDVGTPAADTPQLLDGVLRLLDPPADGAPLVLVLEDVQWADEESLELATQVASGLVSGGVLIVVTLREGEDADRAAVVSLLAAASRRADTRSLRVEGLDPDATSALLAQVSGRDVEPELTRVVHERVEGNPFYAIELLRLLDAEGLDDAASVAARAVPAGVRDVVRQRLARLPPPTRELLEVAAVAGRDVDVELVAAASTRPVDTCLDDLEVALAHRLLVEAGPRSELRFSHALVREVMVDELSSLRCARLHLLLADAIVERGRGEDEAEIVAEHLWEAVAIGVGRRAADALDHAAEVAIRRFALGGARDLLERSLQLRRAAGSDLDDAAAELGTLTKLVWVLRAQRGYAGGLEHHTRGVELARRLGLDDVQLEMQWAEWAGHAIAGELDRSRPVADRFRTWAEASTDPTVVLAGFTAWAIQCWHDGDLRASAAMFARAAEARASVARGLAELSLGTEIVVLSTAFSLYLEEQVGALDRPEETFAAAADDVVGNLRLAVIWGCASTSATSVGDVARVERATRRVLDAEAGETLGFWGPQARMYRGAALVATGRADEGRPLFDAGLRAFRAGGMHTGLALMLATAASAEVIARDLDRAARHLADARAELALGERWPVPFVLLAGADLAEATGASPTEVRRQRQEAEALALDQGAVRVADRARAAMAGERWSVAAPQTPGDEASASSPNTA